MEDVVRQARVVTQEVDNMEGFYVALVEELKYEKKNDWIQRANQQFLTRASEEDKIIDSTADNNYHTSEEKFEDQIRNSVILYIQNKIPQAPDRSNISEIMATWTLPSAVKKDDVPEP